MVDQVENFDSRTRPGKPLFSTDMALPESIRKIDMGPVLWLIQNPEDKSKVEWNQRQTKNVIGEYRRFLTLALEGEGKITSPSRNVDVIWHHHILDTEKYHADMIKVFGHMIHHFPYLGVRGSKDRAVLLAGYKDTKSTIQAAVRQTRPK